MRYMLSMGRRIYGFIKNIATMFSRRPQESKVIPNSYTVCNTSTVDSEYNLNCVEGSLPNDIDGSLYVCQCLGTPEAFMVGDTNLVRMDFNKDNVHLKNRRMWTPSALARLNLKKNHSSF